MTGGPQGILGNWDAYHFVKKNACLANIGSALRFFA